MASLKRSYCIKIVSKILIPKHLKRELRKDNILKELKKKKKKKKSWVFLKSHKKKWQLRRRERKGETGGEDEVKESEKSRWEEGRKRRKDNVKGTWETERGYWVEDEREKDRKGRPSEKG